MLIGLGRSSAVVWTLVGLLVFWLLTGAAFSGRAMPIGEAFTAWALALALGACWLFSAAAGKPCGAGC